MTKQQLQALMSYAKKFNLEHLPATLVIGLWQSGYSFHETSKSI